MTSKLRSIEHPPDSGLLRASFPLLGRDAELEALTRGLNSFKTVTLLGPPGVGKSHLAHHLATSTFAQTPLVIDASHITANSLLVSKIASASGALPDGKASDEEILAACIAALRFQKVDLLIFDDLARTHGTLITHLSHALPDLAILATAHAPLRYPGERIERLKPLELDAAYDLYVARARRVAHEFDFEHEQARVHIDALVERLDRLPLAIELAAGRAHMLPPAEFIKRLPRRLDLLHSRASNPNTLPSLRASLSSAVSALEPPAREVLGQLALMCGPLTLEAAEAILVPPDDAILLELLEELIDCSMIVSGPSEVGAGEVELRVLESLRDFVRQEHPALHADECMARAMTYFLESGERWMLESRKASGQQALRRIEHASSNLACLVKATERFTSEQRQRAGLVLDALWKARGAGTHHEQLLEELLEQSRDDEILHARALQSRASLHYRRGQHEQARALHHRIEALCDEVDVCFVAERAQLERALGASAEAVVILESVLERPDLTSPHEALILATLAASLIDIQDVEGAEEIARDLGDILLEGDLLLSIDTAFALAYVQYYLGQHGARLMTYEQASRAATELGDVRLMARAEQGIAECHYAHGEWEAAIEHFEDALVHHRRCGSRYAEGVLLGGLAAALHRHGDLERAEQTYREALRVHRETRAVLYEGVVLHGWAALAHERGDLVQCDGRYAMALEHAATHEHVDDWAGVALCRSWALCLNYRLGEASEHTSRAAEYLDAYPAWLALTEVTSLLVDVLSQRTQHVPAAQARQKHQLSIEDQRRGHVLAALILDATLSMLLAQDEETGRLAREQIANLTSRPAAHASLYARLATYTARVLSERHQESAGQVHAVTSSPASSVTQPAQSASNEEPGELIAVGPQSKWLKIGDADRINLSRRRSIRRILDALVQAQGGEPLNLYELFEIGWPGQEIAPELAAERVYWAIRTIRDFGLRHWITTSDNGYALDPNVIVSREVS